jgi:hypothetical protein
MISCPNILLSALVSALTLSWHAPALADGPTLLTVTGAIESTNRGPVDPEYDKLFVLNDVVFDKAMQFDYMALSALPQQSVRTDFPRGGEMVEFGGPLLADVLDAAGAGGETVTVRAVDGYAIELPLEDLIGKGAVLALMRNGEAFGIGDFGPAQIVFPRGDRADLSDMPDDWWIYQIYNIVVE